MLPGTYTYCVRQDIYDIGLPPAVFALAPRRVEGVVPATGTIQLRSHGQPTGAAVKLCVLSIASLGAVAAALPSGLVVGTSYGIAPVDPDSFQLQSSPGGALITSFGDAGSGESACLFDSGRLLDAAIVSATAIVDEYGRSHQGPIQAPILPTVTAHLAARVFVATHAPGNQEFVAAVMNTNTFHYRLLSRLFEIWESGAQMQNATDATPTVAEMGAVVVPLEGRGFLEHMGSRA